MSDTRRESTGFTYEIALDRKVGDKSFDNIVLHRGYLLEDWEANVPGMVRRVVSETKLHRLRCDEVMVTWDFTHPGRPTNRRGREYAPVELDVTFSGERMNASGMEDDIELQLFQRMVIDILREQVVPKIEFTERGEAVWVNPEGLRPA